MLPKQITVLIIFVMPGNLPAVDRQLIRSEVLPNLQRKVFHVWLPSAALAHTHRVVSNRAALKLKASALTWCSASSN